MSRFGFIKQRIFSALRRRVLGSYAQGVVYQTANGLLAAPLEDVTIAKTLGFKGGYDTREIDELRKLILPGDIINVVGTHIGALLIPLASSCKEVIGYEANPDTYKYVKINVQLNAAKNIRLYNLAIGDRARTVEFYQNISNSGGSKIKPVKDHYFYTYDSPKTIEVPMVSLDEHIVSEQLPSPNGIIMDIEGAEFVALKGMTRALVEIRFLYIEYVPHHLDNVSGVSSQEFFDLIMPHFQTVRFIRNQDRPIDLRKDESTFRGIIKEKHAQGHSDDLLFAKS